MYTGSIPVLASTLPFRPGRPRHARGARTGVTPMSENGRDGDRDSGEAIGSGSAGHGSRDVTRGAGAGDVPGPRRIRFTGSGSEYFGIWIVNVLLSVVTVGVWTAWAKVRRLRYFNGRTVVLGDPLEYHATGWMIFKGRVLVLLVLAASSGLSEALANVHAAASAVPGLALLALYPWVLNRSLRFSARMTSWRNVRFDWRGTYWGVTKAYFLWPLLGLLTLGACIPLAARALRHYTANNHLFGTTRFSAHTPVRPYYAAFGWSLLFVLAVVAGVLLVVAGVLGSFALFGIVSGATFTVEETLSTSRIPFGAGVLLGLLAGILLMFSGLVFTALARNVIVNALGLGDAATFGSDLEPLRLVWIAFSNFLVSIATLFLLLPWAQVRAFRYQAERVTVAPKVPLSTFVDREARRVAAFGQEFAEMEGLDVSI